MNIKKIVRLSWIKDQARSEFEIMKKHPELDADFFTEEELEHYVDVMIRSHEDEWIVINDLGDEGII